jgi:hypothetical protein
VSLQIVRTPKQIDPPRRGQVVCIVCKSKNCVGRCRFERRERPVYEPPKGA